MSKVLSHSRDTVAAHEAAEHMDKSGKAAANKMKVLKAVFKEQGQTGPELGEVTGLGHIEAQRRISDLKNDGLVEYRGRKQCSVKKSSRPMSCVYLTAHGAQAVEANRGAA